MRKSSSAEAYAEIKNSGKKMSQENLIVLFMRDLTPAPSDWTLKEISRALRLEINTVSGRVNGLKKKGSLVACPKRRCRVSGRTVIPVRVKDW